jgi:hypothetical protein
MTKSKTFQNKELGSWANNIASFFSYWFFWDRILVDSPDWPQPRDLSNSDSQVLGLQACTMVPIAAVAAFFFFFWYWAHACLLGAILLEAHPESFFFGYFWNRAPHFCLGWSWSAIFPHSWDDRYEPPCPAFLLLLRWGLTYFSTLGWPWIELLLISTSQVTGITGMSHGNRFLWIPSQTVNGSEHSPGFLISRKQCLISKRFQVTHNKKPESHLSRKVPSRLLEMNFKFPICGSV